MDPRFNPPAPDADTSLATEQLLSSIDAVLRRCALPEALAHYVTAEKPVAAEGSAPGVHHPDSACVLRRCRERHPDWTKFPERTVRAVLVQLLHDRARMAILARLCAEQPSVVERVRQRLAALSPDHCEDDLWWVCHELARRYPAMRDYDYSERQIRRAWKRLRSWRTRFDHVGVGGPRCEARRQRRVALATFAAETGLEPRDLLRREISDYDPSDGTLALRTGNCRLSLRLSEAARHKVEKWLTLRGSGVGGLFDLPGLAEYWEAPQPLDLLKLHESPGSGRSAATVEDEEYVESLCAAQDALVRAFVLANLSDRGGDWSPEFLGRLRTACGAMAEHVFTRHERRHCRQRLRDRLNRG